MLLAPSLASNNSSMVERRFAETQVRSLYLLFMFFIFRKERIMNLFEYPKCNIPMGSNIDEVAVISQIIDKRGDKMGDDENGNLMYPSMTGNHAIFFGQREALGAIMSFEQTLSQMLVTPVATEYFSYPLEDLIHVHYILLDPPKEEEPEEPGEGEDGEDKEPTDPEEPEEGDGEDNTEESGDGDGEDISDNTVDVIERMGFPVRVVCNYCGNLVNPDDAIVIQEKCPDGKIYYYCSEECYKNHF